MRYVGSQLGNKKIKWTIYASKLQNDDKLKIAQSSASYCFMKTMGEKSFLHMQTQALFRANAVHDETLTRRVQQKNKL